jgi:hypothetical protein
MGLKLDFLALSEERILKVFENWVLRRIFGPMRRSNTIVEEIK